MAQTFTNLSIIANNKDAAKQVITQDQGLGNVHKQVQMDSTQSGKDASTGITTMNKNQSSSNKQMQKEMDLSNKQTSKDQNPAKDAGQQFPMKKDLNKEKWTTESTNAPKTDVKVNDKYEGKVESSSESPKKDSAKSEFMDYMQSEMTKSQDKQKMPAEGENQYKPRDGNVEKPRDILGEGPMVKREQPNIAMGNINQPDITYPNVSMTDNSSKSSGQAPTPTYPANQVTSSLKGFKQPNTVMPSFKLPRS